LSLKLLAGSVLFSFLGFIGTACGADELNVYFKTTPRVELLRPFYDPADLSLLVTGRDGRPVEQGSVDIRLDAPKPGRIFPTDFPVVEGTRLNEMRLPLRQGKASWKLLLPIRGEYRLIVDAVTSDGRRTSKTFSFTIRENEKKWLALGGFCAGLFVLGFLAGRIFTGAIGPAVAIGVLLLLSVPMASVGAQADRVAGKALLQIEPATVGKLALVRWSRGNDTVAPLPALLTLTIEHLEKEKIAFAIERIPVAREFAIKFHFSDGARYRVRTLAQVPGEAPLRNEQVVDVIGVAPAVQTSVPAIGLFIVVIAAGLGIGRRSKQHKCRITYNDKKKGTRQVVPPFSFTEK
jgi:hypothetical protein